jgi:2-oxoglutarate ferredoxin oxidoreductase subunit gamma
MRPSEQAEQFTMAPAVTVLLSGSGGQGLILAGRLLAEAAALYDGLDVVQTNSYGPEARGGASRSEVVIGRGEIDILHTPAVDCVVALNQAACDAYYGKLVPQGLLITNSDLVKVVPTTRAVEVPMNELARSAAGNVMAANVVALAVLAAVTKVVTQQALTATIQARVPAAHREGNLKAVEAGFVAAEEALTRLSRKARTLLPDYSFLRENLETAPAPRPRAKTDPIAVLAMSRNNLLNAGAGKGV